MNYNSSFTYNYASTEGGAIYNSSTIQVVLRLFETLKFFEKDISYTAKSILSDRFTVSDFMKFNVLQNKTEYIGFSETIRQFALFDILDSLNVKDIFSDFVVSLFLMDKTDLLDEIKQFAEILESESFESKDQMSLETLSKIADDFSFIDLKEIFALISKYERAEMSDRDPRKALSDFVIGNADGLDNAYDWVIPFDMIIDWRSSNIQVMPQTESSYIETPYTDGSIVENTVYKNRLFNIVAYSQQGLSVYEKEQLKRDITQILDSTKNNPKKLTFQRSDTSFDVQYSGSADISEGPSFVKATIPLEASPYGYPLFEKEVLGSGLLYNEGDADSGCVHRISSGAVNPSFQMGTITYKWSGTVPNNTTLYIDHNNMTCYLETVAGNRTNVIDKLTGDFQVIPKNSSVVITATPETEDYLYTVLKEKILWMGG